MSLLLPSLILCLSFASAFAEITFLQNVQLQGTDGDVTTPTKPIICSINPTSLSRPKLAFSLDKIDPTLCTHILYNGGRIGVNSRIFISDKKHLASLALLKARTSIHTILSIGGWDEGVRNFQTVSRNESALKIFTNSITPYLASNNGTFDSISIAWMWPGPETSYRGGDARDKNDLTLLITHLHQNLPQTSISLLVNGLVPITRNFNLPQLSNIIDMIFVLAQDYAGNWESVTKTGHPSPLYGEKSVDTIITHVLEFVNSSKVILGLPFFGRTFLLTPEVSSSSSGLEEPFKGSFQGELYPSEQEIGYAEVCILLQKENTRVYYDSDAGAMFLKQGRKWVGFDGLKTIREKVTYAEEKGLGGFLINFADTDDFNGEFCGGQKWPLLKGVVGQLGKSGYPDEDDNHSGNHTHHHGHNSSPRNYIALLPYYFTALVLFVAQ